MYEKLKIFFSYVVVAIQLPHENNPIKPNRRTQSQLENK